MKKTTWILGLIFITAIGWRTVSRDRPDPKLAFGRFWIDHQAKSRDEKFEALFINVEHPWGNFATRTFFRGQWEAFHYHILPRDEGALDLIYPATDGRERVVVIARPCSDSGFDFCLDITGNSRGKHRYYSRKEWVVKDGNVEAFVEQLQAELAADRSR